MSFAARIDQAAGQVFMRQFYMVPIATTSYDFVVWWRRLSWMEAGNDLLVGDGGDDILLAEPVMIGYMASRILLRRSPATIGLKGEGNDSLFGGAEQTGSPEVTEMTS